MAAAPSPGRSGSFILIRLLRTLLVGFAVAASLLALASGCGGSGKSAGGGTTSSSSVAAMGARPSETKAAIRRNWEAFFNGSTSSAARVSLLQNGAQFVKTIAAIDSSPLAKEAKAQVTSVTIDGPTTATVTLGASLKACPPAGK